jgi:hypothetical protein
MTVPEALERRAAPHLWLLPLAFLLHDGEELLTMPRWLAAHRAPLAELGAHAPLVRELTASLATTPVQVGIAIASLGALFVLFTAMAARPGRRRFWYFGYLALLGGFTLHALTHLAQALLFGGYVPGLVGAMVVIPPTSGYLYSRLFRAGLQPRSAMIAAGLGLALLVPAALAAHALGRLLGR